MKAHFKDFYCLVFLKIGPISFLRHFWFFKSIDFYVRIIHNKNYLYEQEYSETLELQVPREVVLAVVVVEQLFIILPFKLNNIYARGFIEKSLTI